MESPVASAPAPASTLPLTLFEIPSFVGSRWAQGPAAPDTQGPRRQGLGEAGGARGPSLSAEKGLQEQDRTPDLKLPGLLQSPAPGKPSETSPDC